jgi:hypothetical protein
VAGVAVVVGAQALKIMLNVISKPITNIKRFLNMFISPPKLGKDWIYDMGERQLEISVGLGLLSIGY